MDKKNKKEIKAKKVANKKEIKAKKITNKKEDSSKEILKSKLKTFNESKFRNTEVIFLVVLTAVISLIFGYLLNHKPVKKEKTNDEYINEIIKNYNNIVDNYYEDVDKEKLVSGAVNGMVNALGDDYSELLDQDNDSSFYIRLDGTYEGIGVEIYNNEDNDIKVLSVIDDSPAQRAGIQVGDTIKKIDDTDLTGTKTSELTNYVRTNKKDSYILVIERDGSELTLTIERQLITIKSIASKVIERDNHKIGYIYISIFANATIDQFSEALAELESQGIDALIIDVRNNNGGYLTTATSIVSNFLSSKKVIYQVEKNKEKIKYYSEGNTTKKYPIVVIQDSASASASELLSSSLKEAYNATIVGETSYGKGTIQELSDLNNGDKYKITTKKWLTPKGNSIDGVGVKPDIEVSLSDKYLEDPTDDNDNQLQAAIEYLVK